MKNRSGMVRRIGAGAGVAGTVFAAGYAASRLRRHQSARSEQRKLQARARFPRRPPQTWNGMAMAVEHEYVKYRPAERSFQH